MSTPGHLNSSMGLRALSLYLLATAGLVAGYIPLQQDGIASANPTREAYLADLAAIRASTSPPSPPRAPSSSINDTDTGPVLSYTMNQISRIVAVDILQATMSDTLRALESMPKATAGVTAASMEDAAPSQSISGEGLSMPDETLAPSSAAASPPQPRSPPPPEYVAASPPPPPTTYTPLGRATLSQLPAGLVPRVKTLAGVGKGCPGTRSARIYGARGDGTTDDSAALLATAAAQSYVYLPVGTYLVAKSITLTKPILAGSGTSIKVGPGVTLTLTAQVYRAPIVGDPFFTGAGAVKFAAKRQIYPDWFIQGGESDWVGLQRAGDSCTTTCTLLLHRIFYLSRQWYVNYQNEVFGTRLSMIIALNNYGRGVMFRPGEYTRPFVVPSVRHFTGFCVKVQGGVRGLNLQISTVSYCQEGISFDTTTTTPKTISNVVVGHVAAAQSNQHSVTFRAASSSDTFSNVNVNINFVLTSGLTYPSLTASGLGFFGVPGTLSSTTVTFQAYDPAQFLTVTQASTVNNYASAAVQGVRFSVDTWLGGLVTPGNMITGAYKGLNAMLNVAGGMAPEVFFSMTGDAATSISIGTVGSAGVVSNFLTSPTSLSTFNNGEALIQNLDWLRFPITSSWAPGAIRTVYYYSEFAGTGITGAKLSCEYGRWYNPGIVCVGFSVKSNPKMMVAVQLRNAGATTIPGTAGIVFFVGVQTGP
ncbi:hypothetical protein F751_5478 [Auxenochlorella protothecoides]|uniref:Rhamnogalacturonase A/B/Epimerase-like pectate lyase domain-containing protein n=1 Tax=Auxenochlorella protothecoides TaxID=3075 RepID=A0A087STR8_AUXPR|nr:hypothetical protein F751_5478 [Auxenochlorella protothecoides]KFM29122.1 hypothetical protein F751_5478 [Auxenochlorella protothecoides]